MIASICTKSDCMPLLACSSNDAISTSSCIRARGVRRSWEIPARIMVRSASIRAKSSTILLKLAFVSRISFGPNSGSGCGCFPCASRRAALLSRERGPLINVEITAAPSKVMTSVAVAQLTIGSVIGGSRRSSSKRNQY